MARLLIFLTILTAQLARANDDAIVCPLLYASKVKKIAEAKGSYDKFKHCSVSCMLTLRCPATDVMQMGLLKEAADVLGYGSPEMADMKANMTGISLAMRKKAKTDAACMNQCQSIFNKSCQ